MRLVSAVVEVVLVEETTTTIDRRYHARQELAQDDRLLARPVARDAAVQDADGGFRLPNDRAVRSDASACSRARSFLLGFEAVAEDIRIPKNEDPRFAGGHGRGPRAVAVAVVADLHELAAVLGVGGGCGSRRGGVADEERVGDV